MDRLGDDFLAVPLRRDSTVVRRRDAADDGEPAWHRDERPMRCHAVALATSWRRAVTSCLRAEACAARSTRLSSRRGELLGDVV